VSLLDSKTFAIELINILINKMQNYKVKLTFNNLLLNCLKILSRVDS